jgi:hypothetical protein
MALSKSEIDEFMGKIESKSFTPRSIELISILLPFMDESPSIRVRISEIIQLEIESQNLESEFFQNIQELIDESNKTTQ